ncbi:unnamed protein product [Rotaria sp. Silwood2]|nr:unnamed protein product [Rotaria sp. Silwood2]
MNNIDQTRLARLRPEKLDDVSVKEQILLIQKACGNVNPEKIALVFHECDYNMQETINRIRAGDFEDGGWQTAKSNNKKKNHNISDQKMNGNNLSDSERSLSQRTSPTSSLRGGHHRNDHYQYSTSIRTNIGRRGNDSGRNRFIPSNSRYSLRNKSTRTTTDSSQPIINKTSSIPKQINEELTQIISPLTDEYEFIDGIRQSLSFDNSQMKTSLQTLSKRQIPSTIPREPVSMHPAVKFPTEPIDIQFGDVQWNDSVPIAVSPSNNTVISTTLDNHHKDILSTIDTDNNQENEDVQDTLSSTYINHQTTNEIDNSLLETTNQLSSLSIIDNTILPIVPPEGTSHLSDHLTDTSSPIPTQYSSQPPVPIQIPITRLPPTSTPRAPDHTSTTSQFMLNNLQQSNSGIPSSAFTPFNTLVNYSSLPRDYSQTTNWNPQTSNYKTNSKQAIFPTGTYQQQQQQPSYQIPSQQQQIFLGTYPYSPLSPAVVPVFASIDQWPTATFSTPMESYPYATTNYISTYPNQQQFHLLTNKYDPYSYDKEFFAQYGQTRSINNDISYQQQQTSSLPQSTKDTHTTSKLSPNAATFCQGAPLAASPSTATTLFLNPVGFSMPNYYPSVAGSIHQDRILSYSSLDNRDNRSGASYSSTNNRNNYYHHGQQQQQQQQQRAYNNNGSNSTWHLQQ